MKLKMLSLLIAGILSFAVTLFPDRLPADPVVFTVDDSQSQINLSGNIAGYTFATQGTGSLTASYSGDINADVSGSTIQFLGSSQIIAQINGVWQPAVGGGAGSASADYGAKVSITFFGTAYAAARNIVLDLTSPLLAITGTNFDSTQLVFSFPSSSAASLDYNASIGNGTVVLSGYSTNAVANGASISTNGNTMKLLIQINAQFTYTALTPNDSLLVLTGQVVATNLLAAPVIIRSIVLTGQSVVLTVENATAQSQLQVSSDLKTWLPVSALVSTNAGLTIFTAPLSSSPSFFRVAQ